MLLLALILQVESKDVKHEVERRTEQSVEVISKASYMLSKLSALKFALSGGDVELSKRLLQEILDTLGSLKKDYPKDKLPVDIVVSIVDNVIPDSIEIVQDSVRKAVDSSLWQLARFYLEKLRSEVITEIYQLDLGAFEKAMNLSKEFLEEGKIEDALRSIELAFSALDKETIIVAKPLVEAQILVREANKLFSENPERAIALLEEAKNRIELARKLGYIDGRTANKLIKDVDALIENVRKEKASRRKFEDVERKLEREQERR